jgi:hypothetical protein
MQATMEELMEVEFSVQSMLRLYNKLESESWLIDFQSHMKVKQGHPSSGTPG